MFRMGSGLIAMVAAVGLTACGEDEETSAAGTPAARQSIVDVARAAGGFTTLVGALESTGLDATLSGPGPFTVFAPTDAAFARLPQGVLASLDEASLAEVLTYHVVSGKVMASSVVGLASATTVQGEQLAIRLDDGAVLLDGLVAVTATDIAADNGVIHVIDAVLLPPSMPFPGDLVDAAVAYPELSTLVGAVTRAQLATALQGGNSGQGFTLFAPTNAAFAALGVDLAALSDADLTSVLLNHVVSGTVNAAAVVGLSSAPTLGGGSLSIDASSGVKLNGEVNVVYTDIETSNGIIHVIDAVLVP